MVLSGYTGVNLLQFGSVHTTCICYMHFSICIVGTVDNPTRRSNESNRATIDEGALILVSEYIYIVSKWLLNHSFTVTRMIAIYLKTIYMQTRSIYLLFTSLINARKRF